MKKEKESCLSEKEENCVAGNERELESSRDEDYPFHRSQVLIG